MAEIIFPSQVLPELDYNNPILDGCVLGGAAVDGVMQYYYEQPITANVTSVTDSIFEVSGTNDEIVYEEHMTNSDFTVVLHVAPIYNPAESRFILGEYQKGNTGYEWGLYLSKSGSGLAFFHTEGANIGSLGSITMGNFYTVTVRRQAGVWTVQINDNPPATITKTETFSSTYNFAIGRSWVSGSTTSTTSKYGCYFLWKHALTDEQLTSLRDNPYQLFKTEEDKREEYVLSFDVTDDAVTFPTVTLTGDFVVETEMWFPDNNDQGFILSNSVFNGTNGFGLFYRNGDGVSDKMIQPYTSGSSRIASSIYDLLPLDDWHKVTVKRTGGVMQMFIDDVQVGTDWNDSNPLDLDRINAHAGYDKHALKVKYLLINDKTSASNSRLWIFDRTDNPTTIADEYNGALATLFGSPTFERVIPKQSFDTSDYSTLALLNTNENNQNYEVDYDVNADLAGASLSGFPNGLILSTSNDSAITSPLTLTTTGNTYIENMTCDDIDATGATLVHITGCEAQDVTG